MTNTTGSQTYTISSGYATLSDIVISQPQVMPSYNISSELTNRIPLVGTFAPVGGVGPFSYEVDVGGTAQIYSWTAGGVDPFGRFGIYYAGKWGFVMGPYYQTEYNDTNISVKITDANGTTVTKSFNPDRSGTGPMILLSAVRSLPSNTGLVNGAFGYNLYDGSGAALDNGSVQLTDASGYWQTYYGSVIPKNFNPPPVGSYPMTLTDTGSSGAPPVNFTITITPAVLGPLVFTQTGTVYTCSVAGLVVGHIVGTTPNNISNESPANLIINDVSGTFAVNSVTGELVVKNPPGSAGNITFTVTQTDGGVTRTDTITVPVQAGTTLASSNMSMTVASFTNYYPNAQLTQRPVGTPTVTGFPDMSQVTWSISKLQRWSWAMDNPAGGAPRAGIGRPRFGCDASTGAVYVQAQLSDTTGTSGEWFELTATDGPRTCTKRFYVQVTPVVGPIFHVGRGMSTNAPGGTTGYEHLAQVMNQFAGWGGSSANTAGTDLSSIAGATIYVHYDTIAPDTYYVNDWDPNYYTVGGRVGYNGPFSIVGVVGPNGELPYIGGAKGSSGTGIGDKGLFITNDGDCLFQNLELGFIHMGNYAPGWVPAGNNTMSLIRQNGGCSGNITIINCDLHDSDVPIEAGECDSQWTLTNVRISNGAGCTSGGGANQHNAYLGEIWNVVADNLLSINSADGHIFKCRAANGTWTNCRFYDTERGSGFNAVDLPEGGNHTFTNCHFEKGPMAENPYLLQFAEELPGFEAMRAGTQDYVQSLTLNNCTFTRHSPDIVGKQGINFYGRIGPKSGQPSTLTLNNVVWEGIASADRFVIHNDLNTEHDFTQNVTETGSTFPTTYTALNMTTPVSHDLGRPGWHDAVAWLNNSADYPYFNAVQIDPGVDEIRIPANSAPGTVICANMRAYGAPNYSLSPNPQPDPAIAPFVAGTTWSAGQTATWHTGESFNWNTAHYTFQSNGDGSGKLLVGSSGLGGTGCDKILIRATSPSSTGSVIVENGFFVVKT